MDSAVELALRAWAGSSPDVTAAVKLVANYGMFVFPGVLITLWWWPRTTLLSPTRAVLTGGIAALCAAGVGLILERTLTRPRPFVALGFEPLFPHAADSSFPSDHTLVGVALVAPLLWWRPSLGIALVLWAVVIGFARAAAGVHYPSDILGSALLAAAIDLVVAALLSRLPPIGRLRFGNFR